MKRMKGFTLIELLIVVAIIAILAAIAVPNFLEAQVRSKVSRVQADMRSMATAIESYYVDTNAYPACTTVISESVNSGLASATRLTFRTPTGTQALHILTTPIAYVTNYFVDPFADTKGTILGYYATGDERLTLTGSAAIKGGWILMSYGPDVDEKDGGQLQGSGVTPLLETAYVVSISQPSVTLLSGLGFGSECFTYDPTNGTVSAGDIYRVKQ